MPTEIRINESAMPMLARRSRTHLVIDGVCDRNRQRAIVTEIARLDDDIQSIEELEYVDAGIEFETEQRTGMPKQSLGERVLRMRFQPRIVHLRDARIRLQFFSELRARSRHCRSRRNANVSAPIAMW